MESEERKKSGEDKGPNPKRQMKTPSQLEVLERVYADNRYPSEAVRAELAVQLNLTDRQLQMWFCHRRLKDRKDDENPGPSKKQKKEKAPKVKDAPSPVVSPAPAMVESLGIVGQAMSVVSPSMALSSSLVAPSPPPPPSNKKASKKKQQPKLEQPVLTPEQHAELAAIRTVEQQLGEPLREDGPVLGCEFDPLPPGAFDTPIEPADQRTYALEALRPVPNPEFPSLLGNRRMSPQTTNRIPREHQFIPEHPTSQFHERSIVSKVERDGRAKAPPGAGPLIPNLSLNFFHPADVDAEHDEPPPPKPFLDIERPPPPEPTNKKRKSDDAKLARELELQEKKLKREADKQEAARRKREEQERKEIEKMNRERQKEMEKINRERQREEERQQREQKKEQDRMEKLALKEQQRLEKLRVKEEQRRQKEAAKMQAAYERATAKKLAKLSTGLLEDEQLELMQMGAFVQGLVTADMEGANFDTSKVELKKYPPSSVRMRKVLGIAPWESQQNVANLLMIWRFLTTFSDAIGLWPFTVDEFVQGLHDFDSRLLNEIYVALLKTLIKDVEDAAQAAASGTAGSQHAIAVAAGGHPQIVEAAYTWGFDIQEWGQHMNPLTWPEVLRQFALAAGYGPRWKKRSLSADQKTDFTEVNDGHNANAIATLRSGAAAVNAVALMRGKNATRVKLKKAQMPKLTPGTVKYAAFHVLSIEGGKGLTITELTDRIQKSGLRDLSSSKTPEASISAALSRDTVLFERVAPSTYCVRSPFRRDTDEAEDVIQAALERTYLYQTRQLDPDKADELIDDAEDESEGDEHDTDENEAEQEQEPEPADPETNYDTPAKPGKVILRLKTGKAPQASGVRETAQGEPSTVEPVSVDKEDRKPETEDEVKPTRTSISELVRKDEDDMEIDESQVGEPWVQGLMEGEFADLSIEERLNALVALVDVLNEGNTIRSVLEARYEAASAFKRQLWEEVQVDKRRLKEELTKSGAKAEPHDDERQNHATDFDNVASTSASLSDKSRVQVKAEIRLRAEKLYVIRSLPLGSDRRYNRYWQFAASTGGEDPGRARIYFESNEDGHFEVIDTEEAMDALLASLDTRGVRESSLYNALTQIGGPLRKAMKSLAQLRASESFKSEESPSSGVFGPSDVSEVSSAISVELGRNKLEIQHAMDRFKDLEGWLWNRCLIKGNKSLKAVSVGARQDVDPLASCEFCHSLFWPTENHCPTCHTAIDESHPQECEERAKSLCSFQVPPRLQLLKRLLVVVEVAIPTDAFKSSWTSTCRKSWCDAVKDALSVRELLQAFTVLEGSVDEKWISSSYETTEKALSSTVGPAGSHLKNLPWVPQTTAAVALRLCAFDAAIAFNTEQRAKLEQKEYIQRQAPAAGTPAPLTRGHEESPSSPDSDSPPDFPNGHTRLPPRPQGKMQARMRACNASNAGGRKLSVKGPKQPQRQPAQQQGRGKGRLSFRVQGRVVSSNDSYQREDEEPPALIHHPPPPPNEEYEDSDGWERQSDETEHSDDEPEQQQAYYHEEHQEAAHHHSQMPQHEQEETDEDEEEYEEQHQPQEQYEEEYYEDEYEQTQQHQHQHQQAEPVGMMMMMDDEDEEVEVEEVEEEMSEEE